MLDPSPSPCSSRVSRVRANSFDHQAFATIRHRLLHEFIKLHWVIANFLLRKVKSFTLWDQLSKPFASFEIRLVSIINCVSVQEVKRKESNRYVPDRFFKVVFSASTLRD